MVRIIRSSSVSIIIYIKIKLFYIACRFTVHCTSIEKYFYNLGVKKREEIENPIIQNNENGERRKREEAKKKRARNYESVEPRVGVSIDITSLTPDKRYIMRVIISATVLFDPEGPVFSTGILILHFKLHT